MAPGAGCWPEPQPPALRRWDILLQPFPLLSSHCRLKERQLKPHGWSLQSDRGCGEGPWGSAWGAGLLPRPCCAQGSASATTTLFSASASSLSPCWGFTRGKFLCEKTAVRTERRALAFDSHAFTEGNPPTAASASNTVSSCKTKTIPPWHRHTAGNKPTQLTVKHFNFTQ